MKGMDGRDYESAVSTDDPRLLRLADILHERRIGCRPPCATELHLWHAGLVIADLETADIAYGLVPLRPVDSVV